MRRQDGWVEGSAGITPPSEIEILNLAETAEPTPFVDNNPFGGQRGIGSGKGRPSVRGSPNAHLLAFVRNPGMAEAQRVGSAAAFAAARRLRKEEGRPIVGAWGPAETVVAIREVLPEYQTWEGPQTEGEGLSPRPPLNTRKGGRGMGKQLGTTKDGKPRFAVPMQTKGGADLAHFVKFSVPALTKEGLGPHDGESPELFFERVDVGGDGLVTRTDMKRYRAAALAQRRNEV